MFTRHKILTLGLFEKRIEGDDCLMELARGRFEEARMGVEVQAGTPAQLDGLLRFRPTEESAVVVHLPRDFDLAQAQCRDRIMDLARLFAGRVYGMVIHDHAGVSNHCAQYVEAAWDIENRLGKIDGCPILFVEYAAGIEPTQFTRFFGAIQDLDRVSACIDIGHIGIRQARAFYAERHAGQEVCALNPRAALPPKAMDDIDAAVRFGAAAAVDLVDAVGAFKKPLHFHLHDAHPLSRFSPFGVSDHLSFFAEIPVGVESRERRAVPPMFGPEGLSRVIARALKVVGSRGLSFTLEIHPTGERLPLGDAESIFSHWAEKANAEKMNHWMSVLARNHVLLRDSIQKALPQEVGTAHCPTSTSQLG